VRSHRDIGRHGLWRARRHARGESGGEGHRAAAYNLLTLSQALAPLIDKPAPGLTHLLVAASLQYTPLAALSRPVCGVSLRRPGADGIGALVVALPGSRKAVRECLEALGAAGVLAHALDLVTGGSGRAVHARLQGPEGGRDGAAAAAQGVGGTETDTGHARVGGTDRGTHHAHHHGDHVHHHGDHAHHHSSHSHSHSAPQPRTAYVTVEPGAPAGRHRQSPYTLQPLDAALALIAQHTPGAGAARREPLARLAGCVLAADVCASLDLPPRATSNVDGYAVLAASTPAGEYRVVRGGGASGPPQGAVCRINTGQALPLGTDAVVMVEDTQLLRATAAGEEEAVRVLAQVDARENVRAAGSDVRAGDVVLRAGQRVGTLGGEIGTLAFLGCAEVSAAECVQPGVKGGHC
jgi:gephyrin